MLAQVVVAEDGCPGGKVYLEAGGVAGGLAELGDEVLRLVEGELGNGGNDGDFLQVEDLGDPEDV